MARSAADFVPGYYWYSQSGGRLAPSPGLIDEIVFGLFSPQQGTDGEIVMSWRDLRGRPTARLDMFSDGWHLFRRKEFKRLLEALTESPPRGPSPTPEQFAALLDELGFTDMTNVPR